MVLGLDTKTTQGRLNQWAHWARADPAPDFFFLFEGPPTGCGEIIFLKLIILLLMVLHDQGPRIFSEGPRWLEGAQGPNAGKDGTETTVYGR